MSVDSVPVYVIDDDDALLDSMRFLLESMGISSTHFSDPFEFLQSLKSLPPGCVLTDLRMPGLSGLELNQAVRARNIDWPIILMSANVDRESCENTPGVDFIEVIEKPFTASKLKSAIENAFAKLDGTSGSELESNP